MPSVMFLALARQAAGGAPLRLGLAATPLDDFFAYSIVALLVGLVWWNSRNTPDPKDRGARKEGDV